MKRTIASMIRNLLLAFAGAALLAPSAWGQTASLVRDIDTERESPASSSPGQLLTVGDKIFFVAAQAGSGHELWVSDGSGIGTQMLGDVCPGTCDADPILLGGTGGVLIFAANVPNNQGRREEVWRSDGTRKGTFALRSAGSEPIYSDDSRALPLAGALLFSGCKANFECQLWRTNGTPEGTQPLTETRVFELVAAEGKAYLFTDDDVLWVSDGTTAGTHAVSERLFRFSFRLLTPAGNKVFFLANENGDDGDELWTSDGTAAGTRALTSFPNERPFDGTGGLKVFGNHVYFVADDVIHGAEIWRSDGTPETTRRITEFGFHAPLSNGSILRMEELGGRLLFAATDGLTPTRLWTTSGTPESTAPLQCPGGCPELSADRLLKVGGRVLFGGFDEVHGRELWSTDGTAAGTTLTEDVCPGSCSGLPQEPKLLLGTSFFIARIEDSFSQSHFELWTSDGTPAGTRRFADPASGFQPALNDSLEIAALGPALFFPGFNDYGVELWASDGNPGGTRLVDNLARGGPGSDPRNLVALADQLLFTACDGNNRSLWKSAGTLETTTPVTAFFACFFSFGSPHKLVVAGPWAYYWREEGSRPTLWRTDGTASGTLQLAELQFGGNDLMVLGNRIFFIRPANDSSTRWEMWQSDGTLAGTRKAFDLPLDVGRPDSLTALGSEMYFIGRSDFGNGSLWRSDGTLAGTLRLKDGLDFETAPLFTRVGSNVFFVADDDSFDLAVWKTNGTGAGTVRVRGGFRDFSNGLSDFTAFHGALYFVAGDFSSSPENRTLWRSDGTEAGTVPIRDFSGENPFDSRSLGMTLLNDRLYFAADDGIHGRELWTSDGTTAGTTLVRDVRPGPIGSQPAGLTAAGGRLFFSAGDADHGFEPWQSDGTEAGTRLLQDLAPYGASSYPELFTAVGGKLYFTADDRLHGSELWALPLAGSGGCQPTSTSLCLNGGRFKVEAAWRDFQGNIGNGHAVALTPDTGYFWFFGPANVEVILKVLDGRTLNDHFWVFFGALSNVEYTLTVTDTTTGATRRYFNPSGTFGSIGDTRGFGPLGAFSSADQSLTNPAKTLLPLVAERTDAAAATGVCVPGAKRLCLNDGRFAVEATWKDFGGLTGSGTAVPLSADTGYFWFFNEANVEVVLKVLDGQAINGRFWVFYGALSNVEYTLTVTDTITGHIRTYTNPSGRFGSIGDTGAF